MPSFWKGQLEELKESSREGLHPLRLKILGGPAPPQTQNTAPTHLLCEYGLGLTQKRERERGGRG